MTGSTRAIGLAGLIGVALNVIAVLALQPFTSPYSPADIPGWLASCAQYPIRTAVSSFAFVFGLIALAAFAIGYAAKLRTAPAIVAASFIALGALLDAAGCPAPLVALNAPAPIGEAFLRFTLLLDAAFNGALGIGLIIMAFAQPGRLRWLALASGIISLPVSLQWASADAAQLLVIAGPLWLAWFAATSVGLLRTDP